MLNRSCFSPHAYLSIHSCCNNVGPQVLDYFLLAKNSNSVNVYMIGLETQLIDNCAPSDLVGILAQLPLLFLCDERVVSKSKIVLELQPKTQRSANHGGSVKADVRGGGPISLFALSQESETTLSYYCTKSIFSVQGLGPYKAISFFTKSDSPGGIICW